MTISELSTLCAKEFPDLVAHVRVVDPRRQRIRIDLLDGTFIDVHQGPQGRYSYHWERGGDFVRFNNAPHFDEIETAPHHMHVGMKSVQPSAVRGVSTDDVRLVLQFVQRHLEHT